MITQTCEISGETFEVSDLEIKLRKNFGLEDPPTVKPKYRWQHLGAFWQHWNLHHRKCDKTGKKIISVFSENCPYPVWHKDEWVKHANPPYLSCHPELVSGSNSIGVFDFTKPVFEQIWTVFQQSPIPHNIGINNENCEYTDDWWYSKNCYLCHSGYQCEDLKYCYRTLGCKDSQFCVFSFDSELCADLINSRNCFESAYLLNCRSIQKSAFLYDCRNCTDCLFCFNLRNKKYCFGNQQLTKAEFEQKKKEWNLTSQKKYEEAKTFFTQMMKTMAWHRSAMVDKCENTSGNFLENCKNAKNCFLISNNEDVINCIRSSIAKNTLDCVNTALEVELIFDSSSVLDKCYQCTFGYNLIQSKFCEYSAFLQNCENCFGCCGLINKKYHIFNKKYSPKEYAKLKKKIIKKMKENREYGEFFPGYFAANPYDESWSAFHFPLSKKEQEKFGFRTSQEKEHSKEGHFLDTSEIPDNANQADSELTKKIFWDTKYKRPFQINQADIDFAKKLKTPLPHSFYMNRRQENFRWLFFDGELRKTKCAKSGNTIETNWPSEYDGRILCETEYLKILN